jgi:FPC/CPF motif-containing protein YcgG
VFGFACELAHEAVKVKQHQIGVAGERKQVKPTAGEALCPRLASFSSQALEAIGIPVVVEQQQCFHSFNS